MVLYLFIVRISLLIFSSSVVGLLLGWDGLGITSFLLVTRYGDRKSSRASMSTAISNRVGDCFFIGGIVFLFPSWDLAGEGILDFIGCLFILLASFTKRAQVPFSCWLTEAIEAPTPVRALVHSSTLITAGIFLIIRFFFFLNYYTIMVILFFGLLTASIACYSSFFTNDRKKLVALSTLTQVRAIFFILGVGSPTISFVYLSTHAFSKALTFIIVGLFMTAYSTKNFTKNNDGVTSTPVLGVAALFRNLAIGGLPVISLGCAKDINIIKMFGGGLRFPLLLLFFSFFLVFSSFYTFRKVLSIRILKKFIWSKNLLINTPTKDQIFTFFLLIVGGSWLGVVYQTLLLPSINFPPKGFIALSVILLCFRGLTLGLERGIPSSQPRARAIPRYFFGGFFEFRLVIFPQNTILGGSRKVITTL